VRHEEDDLHPFRTDKVNSGVKLHPSRFPEAGEIRLRRSCRLSENSIAFNNPNYHNYFKIKTAKI
jgi:hypothetical protein